MALTSNRAVLAWIDEMAAMTQPDQLVWIDGSEVGWVCILAAFPFALGGFFQYNSMTFEQFILAVIRSELLYPKRLVFKSDHLYAKALDNSTLKEAVKLD